MAKGKIESRDCRWFEEGDVMGSCLPCPHDLPRGDACVGMMTGEEESGGKNTMRDIILMN